MNASSVLDSNITLRDFLVESENFPFSKDFFDLLKISGEIELMEKYLECQDYILENADLSQEIRSTLITEAVGNTNDISKEVKGKKALLWSKIQAGLIKVVNAIVSFFKRILNVFTNAQGKELEELRKEAAALKADIANRDKINEQSQQRIADRTKTILRGKAHAIQNFRIINGQKDAEIAALNSELKKFKGVDAELYKELKAIEVAIAETITIEVPETVSEIIDFTREMAAAAEAYKSIRGQSGDNRAIHLKSAKKIAAILDKLRSSRNKKAQIQINPVWIKEHYASLVEQAAKVKENINAITTGFNAAHDVKELRDSSKRADNNGIRISGSNNFMELQRNVVMLLNEWMYLANTTIKTLKEFMEVRSLNLKKQAAILAAIRQAAS